MGGGGLALCSSTLGAQVPSTTWRTLEEGVSGHEKGWETGSPLQSQWFQCINNSQHKRDMADNALLPALLPIVLQGIHYFNYLMIGKKKHRRKGDNVLIIICLHETL